MPAAQNHIRFVFEKLRRELEKLATNRAPQRVHRFRTYGRRVEAQLAELIPDLGRNHKRLLKLLAKLRHKAGRARDLDVQIASLRNLKIPEAAGQKRQLLGMLMEERAAQEKKLIAAFDKECVRELRKRLKRACEDLAEAEGLALAQAGALISSLPWERSALTEPVLHQYRVLGKRARYLAEVASKDAAAKQLVAQLKVMQDALGEWHDWWKLTQRAEKQFSGTERSPLVAALRNVTRAKFREAVDILVATRAEIDAAARGPERKAIGLPTEKQAA